MKSKKVIFIAGFGRSGTTIISHLLGQINEWFCAGEIGMLLERRIYDNGPCSCSAPIQSCPVWSQISSEYTHLTENDVERILQERNTFKNHHCWHQLTKRGRRKLNAKIVEMSRKYANLLSRLFEITGSRVIIDASKMPSHGYLLQSIEDIDLYIIHLIRDPRAVAFSWLKNKKVYDIIKGEPRYFPTLHPIQSAVIWQWWNTTINFMWGRQDRYVRVFYEDFIENPKKTLINIAEKVGEKVNLDFFIDDHMVNMEPVHAIAGNPTRFNSGPTKLKKDIRWLSEMSRYKKFLATIFSSPLLIRYGYLQRYAGRPNL